MQTATIERTRTKVKTSVQKTKVAKFTFQEWLAEEAAAGRMTLATGNGRSKLPAKPQETIDFWSIYEEVRADRF